MLAFASAARFAISIIGAAKSIPETVQPRLAAEALVDFFAEWCTACKELDHLAWADPRVRARMEAIYRAYDAVLREAEKLVAAGTRELLVISQDTSAYGLDLKHAAWPWKGDDVRAHMTDLARALEAHPAPAVRGGAPPRAPWRTSRSSGTPAARRPGRSLRTTPETRARCIAQTPSI